MKLIACIPLKNEAWVLKYTLSALSEFVDEIIILDDGSTDDSIKIAESYPKVVQIIKNKNRPDKFRNEPLNWNRLTKAALQRKADWILYTDADEMVEPQIKEHINSWMNNSQAGMYRFRKLSPWKGLTHYRAESNKWLSPADQTLNPVLMRASKNIVWTNPKGSLGKRLVKRIIKGEKLIPTIGRNFPKGVVGNVINLDDIVSVHFNNISYTSLVKKQINYAINEKMEKPFKTNQQIVDWVYFRLDEANIKLAPMEQAWYWNNYLQFITFEL